MLHAMWLGEITIRHGQAIAGFAGMIQLRCFTLLKILLLFYLTLSFPFSSDFCSVISKVRPPGSFKSRS